MIGKVLSLSHATLSNLVILLLLLCAILVTIVYTVCKSNATLTEQLEQEIDDVKEDIRSIKSVIDIIRADLEVLIQILPKRDKSE